MCFHSHPTHEGHPSENHAVHYDKAETFDPEQLDLLKGDLRELDENGNTLEGVITVEGASLRFFGRFMW